jgi:hypothetical protein
MSTNSLPNEQERETILERLSKEDLLSLIKQMIQRHPDLTELIATRQPRRSSNTSLSSQKSIVGKLQRFLLPLTEQNGDRKAEQLVHDWILWTYTEQKQYAEAATLYEIIIGGIHS